MSVVTHWRACYTDYGSSVSESRSCDKTASGTLPPFPRELLMGLHTWEDGLRCLGNATIRDVSLIISRAPAPGAGGSVPRMRQAPCSRDESGACCGDLP